ncbi:twin-arginine translocase subunit TatB [Donghicola sp. C2-DW-16]|uniref:Sec-independent protein translocase protein TatB n=1 Tax=Donghicola mangrovi TaxID=2729614 RepID=A0A850QCE9_9RHOB|nr:Sec-independent protein translocase protein TatB [Donghicola mangrovi]NVO23859.1 twin-arginine translocase subunit TatB [Donghicola mangrovi]NVO27393.1 twin-arginine translocase subunit TatB [Donghicola mangrovi]
MLDLGWSELLLIGIVALIVVGPKDLPILFRNVGQFVGKAKGMAREFSRAMEQAADEAGVKDAANSFKNAANYKDLGLDSVKDAAKSFADWNPDAKANGMDEDRAATARKIHEATARSAKTRQEAEAKAAADAAAPAAATDSAPAAPAAAGDRE